MTVVISELLKDLAAPIGGGGAVGWVTGFVLANTWSDPDGDPLGSPGDGDGEDDDEDEDDKTVAELRDEREGRWMRKGTGIGGCLGLGAMALEALKVGFG